MNQDECTASLKVLLAVVRADGQIHQREKEVLAFLARTYGTRAPSLATELDVEAECARITSETLRRLTFSAALVLADIDEERDPAETALLERLHRAFALPGDSEAVFTQAPHHRERMALVTQKLADANAAFFRGVAKASEDGALDAAEYAVLIKSLDAEKQALLEGVFNG